MATVHFGHKRPNGEEVIMEGLLKTETIRDENGQRVFEVSLPYGGVATINDRWEVVSGHEAVEAAYLKILGEEGSE